MRLPPRCASRAGHVDSSRSWSLLLALVTSSVSLRSYDMRAARRRQASLLPPTGLTRRGRLADTSAITKASCASVFASPPYISMACAIALGVMNPRGTPMSSATANSSADMLPGWSTTTIVLPDSRMRERAPRISPSSCPTFSSSRISPVWICNTFLDNFYRDIPASLNSTGLM